MRYLITLALFFPLVCFAAEAEWPKLNQFGYVSGTPAVASDIAEGKAVFVLQDETGPIGKPIKIEIPQYAMHEDEETGEKTPSVIVQAERAQGMNVVGYINLIDGSKGVGMLNEFELFGKKPPK